MAKKNINKSFAEELRSSAYVWLGNTNIDDTFIFLTVFNNTTHWVIVEVTPDNLILKAPKETLALKKEIFVALYEIDPAWMKKDIGTITTSSLPKCLAVTSDCNTQLFDRGIKPLKQSTVVTFLDNLGVNINMYEYTTLVVDNTHALKPEWVTKGYSNYPKELSDFRVDTSKYKNYTMTKPDEYEMLDMGCYIGMIAAGPAGPGKSTDALIYGEHKEIPIISFQCTPGIEEDSIIGKWQPKSSGGFEFVPGPLALALQYDCWLIINEANYAPAGVMSCLNSVMDDNAQVYLPNGTTLHRGKNFRLILTVNPGYRGTNMFNEATLNRFVTVYYEPLTKKDIINRLQFHSEHKNMRVLEAIADQFESIRKIYESKNMDIEVTFRNASHFLSMLGRAPHISLVKQFDLAFINNVIYEGEEYLEEFKEIRTQMVSEIQNVLSQGSEEVKEASWTCVPEPDLDDLDFDIAEDGSFIGEDE